MTGDFEFDPFGERYLADPYAVFARAREEAPVFYAENLDYWVVSRYDDVRYVMSDTTAFSARIAQEPLVPLCDEAKQIFIDEGVNIKPLLSNNDPPDHQRVRRFMGSAFTNRAVKRLETYIRELCVERLDRFDGDSVDLVDELVWDLPLLVILQMLGVPESDIDDVKSWAESRILLTWGHPSKEEQIRLTQHLASYFNYSTELVNRFVETPGDNYTSDLIQVRNGDDEVATLNEIAIQVFNLLIAGHETTSNQAANMFQLLLSNSEIYDSLVADSELLIRAVEESMRLSPSVVSWRRQANVDVEVAGTTIPAGARLLLLLGSGNHDETHYDEPAQFRLDRETPRDHLAFGHGIHLCMGAPLARLELRVMLEEFVARFPHARLTEGQNPSYLPNTSFRGPNELWVTLNGAGS
ncbi:MAG: cytochrome P450 [Acidimicrobiales bacterium]